MIGSILQAIGQRSADPLQHEHLRIKRRTRRSKLHRPTGSPPSRQGTMYPQRKKYFYLNA
jgi:hypothetical protein